MTVTTSGLTRAAAVAAIAAGTIFIGVQVGHPQLTTSSITSTNVLIREYLKVVFAVLAVAGITGMYLNQVRRNGMTGLNVTDPIALATSRGSVTGDLGALDTFWKFQGMCYLAGGLIFGIAPNALGFSLWEVQRRADAGIHPTAEPPAQPAAV